ncbi:Uncharacterized protein SCF082_LOCUS36468 [Durusdinium trenchii]|uniref:Uncharacterized protein n=1 Tax=Durusdinium trenchii TaxID=1381693 RepID=A0ABP0PHN7_9DINO
MRPTVPTRPWFSGDARSRDGDGLDSAAGEVEALREVSKNTVETESWYPEDSMELDAVLAQELCRVMFRLRPPSRRVHAAGRAAQFKSPIMRLDVFLDEDVPEFPFAKVPSVRAS